MKFRLASLAVLTVGVIGVGCRSAPVVVSREGIPAAQKVLDEVYPEHAAVEQVTPALVPPPTPPMVQTGTSYLVTFEMVDGSRVVVPVDCSPIGACYGNPAGTQRTGP